MLSEHLQVVCPCPLVLALPHRVTGRQSQHGLGCAGGGCIPAPLLALHLGMGTLARMGFSSLPVLRTGWETHQFRRIIKLSTEISSLNLK